MEFFSNIKFVESLNKMNEINLKITERDQYLDVIFADNILMKNISKNDQVIYNDLLLTDLEIFQTSNPVFAKINKTKTPFGSSYLKLLLKMPLSNPILLKNRQSIIKNLSLVNNAIEKILSNTHECMDDLIWFWKPQSQESQKLIDIVYFKNNFLQFANKNSYILNATTYANLYIFPLITILNPLIPIITIFLLMKQTNTNYQLSDALNMIRVVYNFNKGNGNQFYLIVFLVWVLIYLYSVYQIITNAILQYKIIQLIRNKLYHLTKFKNMSHQLYELYCTFPEKDLSIDINQVKISLNYIDKYIDVKESSYLFDNKGYTLSSFQKIYQSDEIKNHLIILSHFIGYIDSLLSISKLVENQKGYSYVDFISQPNSIVSFKGLWHPCIDYSKAVLNDSNIQSHRIITGPNAGGKSTYIKNVAILVLLSHVFTIGNCHKCQITPFKLIHSYIHLIDTKGIESLFEAEMNRCFNFIETIKKINPNDHIFAIFDELLTSTNFYEGVSAAYSICLEFIQYPNLLTLMTTHYTQLTELEKDTNKRFRNYRVTANLSDDKQLGSNQLGSKKITFDYKIKKGISNQFIALDLLKLKGFDNRIIENATKYLKKISNKYN